MFSFFKRSKSKEGNNSANEKNDKAGKSNQGSLFNKKAADGKQSGTTENVKAGSSSESPLLPSKQCNGTIPFRDISDNKATSIAPPSDNLNESAIKTGSIEEKRNLETNKPAQETTNTIGNEDRINLGQNILIIPSTSDTSKKNDLPNKSRDDFFGIGNESVKTIDNQQTKISSCNFSRVSEGAISTTPEEIPAIAAQPPRKEGTPDSDIVFKTAPNTPVLTRIPLAYSVVELPSINEDGTTKLAENISEKQPDRNSDLNININFVEDGIADIKSKNTCDNTVRTPSDNSESVRIEKPTDQTLKPLTNGNCTSKIVEEENNCTETKKMAETVVECSAMHDMKIHEDVLPYTDSDVEGDEDLSQETSRSETTTLSINQDNKSSRCSICSNSENPTEEKNPTQELETDDQTNGLDSIITNGELNESDHCNNEINNDGDNHTNIEKEISPSSLPNFNNVTNNNDEKQELEIPRSTKETDDEASESEIELDKNENLTENCIKQSENELNIENSNQMIDIKEENNTLNSHQNEVENHLQISAEENLQAVKEEQNNADHGLGSNDNLTEQISTDHNTDTKNQPHTNSEAETNYSDLPTQSDHLTTTDNENKENLVNIESKADRQIREVTTELKQSEKEINNLKIQVGDLQREVIVKSSGMDRLQAELTAAYKESECVRKKLKKLEEDLDCFKQKNSDLADELNRKTEEENENDYWKVIELENEVKEQAQRIKDLEHQVHTIRQERDKLAQTVLELNEEREEERKIVQEALDEAMAEKIMIQEKHEREFEKLRTLNTDSEQKMLDDFEWKLREVEAACKKRLDDKEQSAKQHVREVETKLNIAEGKIAQLPHLKQCEQELTQLREKSIEHTRALRSSTRQVEQLQNNEKMLQDEVQHFKSLLDKEKAHLTTVQNIHYREISEKERKHQFKLEQQKTELKTEWEEKMKRESQKVKTELERNFRAEKIVILEDYKVQHENKLQQLKSTWEKKYEDSSKEVDYLKKKLAEKEEEFKAELESVQTNSDRDIFELRRKLDKIDVSYQEKMEKIQEKHERELEKVKEEADRKLQQCELNWQQQVGSSRTTIELVKEQMQRESQEQLQSLSEHHRTQLEEQWDQLIQERDEMISMMEQKHRTSMEKLRNELDLIYKSRNNRETELLDTLTHLRQELSGKTNKIDSLQTNVEELHENLEVLSTEINDKSNELTKVKDTTNEKIRQREQQLEELHQGQVMELSERHKKEITTWRNNVEELQKKVAELTKRSNEKNQATDMLKKIDELQKVLKEKDQQVANLSKEKHLYQLELMNKDSVQAKQRRKGGRGGSNNGGGGASSSKSNRGGRGEQQSSRQTNKSNNTTSVNHR